MHNLTIKLILKNLSKMKKTIIILFILSIAVLMVTPVFAGIIPIPSDSTSTGLNIPNPLGGTNDISALASNIIKFLIILAIPITAILVVYAGFLYITSAGNEDKVKTAQKALIWAIVGFAVVLIASSVPAIIQEFLTGEPEEPEQLTEPEQFDDNSPGLPSIGPSPHDSGDVFIID